MIHYGKENDKPFLILSHNDIRDALNYAVMRLYSWLELTGAASINPTFCNNDTFIIEAVSKNHILQGCCAIWDIRPKLVSNSNLRKSRSSITFVSVSPSFWNFVQTTALILPCSVQNRKMIGSFRSVLWTNEILRDMSLRWVSDAHPILHITPDAPITCNR